MNKKVIAILLTLCMLLTAAPIYIGAAEGATVTASKVSVTQGSSVSVTVRAENFQSIASLDVFIYYDGDALSVTGTSNGGMLSGTQASVNKSKAGEVKLSAISLDGINGSGNLLTVTFKASDSAEGVYNIRIAIGDAYDTALSPAAITAADGSVTVNKRVQSETFSIYANYNKNQLSKGDELTYSVVNSSYSRKFASADFVVEYDHEVFEFVSAELESALKCEGALYSVNSQALGQVRITYASTNVVSASYLFAVKLRVIADKDMSTTVKAQAQNVYREDLSPYLGSSCSYTFRIKKLPEVIDYPDLYLVTDDLIAGDGASSTLYLEEGAGVAAGDFSVSYDHAVLRCTGATVDSGIGDIGGMIVLNENFAEGKIRFSYINMEAFSEADIPLIHITWEPVCSPDEHYTLSLSGVGVVDTQQNAVTLEYVTDSDCIHVRTVIPPTCTVEGRTNYTCACGDSYDEDILPALGHDRVYHEAKSETCTEIGWYEYETCTRCDYTTYVEIPALGHDSVVHEAKAETCTGIGWYEYETCTRCDYTTYEEISALGHDIVVHEAKAETCTEIGWNEYETCTRCDYTTYVEIPALGHDRLYHEAKSETCTEIGWNEYETCTRCDYTTYVEISALGHDSVVHEAQTETCTGIGWYEYETCTRCDYTTYVEIPPLGHRVLVDGRIWVDSIETENDEVYPFAFENGVYSSTNKTDSTDSYFKIKALYDCTLEITCSVSSEQNYDKLIIRKNGVAVAELSGQVSNQVHTVELCADDTVTVNYHKDGSVANADDTGWFEISCEQTQIGSYVPGPAEDAEPTCTEAVVCHFCSAIVKEALGHDTVAHEAKVETCTEIGWNEYETCTRCDYTTYEEIAALGHRVILREGISFDCVTLKNDEIYPFDFSDGVYSSTNKYDRSESSFVITVLYDCLMDISLKVSSEAGRDKLALVINGEQRALIAGEEEWSVSDVKLFAGDIVTICYFKDITCSAGLDTGWFSFSCRQALGDSEIVSAEDVHPTCTDPVICDFCDAVVTGALGHDTVIHEAKDVTCTEIGWNEYETCTRCDYTTYVEIPALGHDKVYNEAKSETCTEIGWNEYETCTRCDYTTYVEIPALGHDKVYHEAKSETCTEIGWNEYETCNRCDYTTYEEISALGHDIVVHAAKSETCTDIGWNEYETCTRCDYTTYVEIPALGHDTVAHEAKAETCTEIGWNEYETCSRCDYTTYVEIPALGHDTVIHEAKSETCTEIGWNEHETCTRCDYTTYVEIPALGHDIVVHEAKEATCTEIGWNEYETCTRCDYTTYVEIPALGHDIVVHEPKDVTCTENGWNEYETCTRCDYTTYVEIPARGHSYENSVAYCDFCGLAKKAVSVTIFSMPEKTEYMKGESSLDLTGGKISVTFEDGVKAVFLMDKSSVTGFDTSTAGNKTLTLTAFGLSVSFDITVIETTVGIMIGDITGDGAINGKDAFEICCIVAGRYSIEEGSTKLYAADIDGDGSISGKDANLLRRIVAGSYDPN